MVAQQNTAPTTGDLDDFNPDVEFNIAERLSDEDEAPSVIDLSEVDENPTQKPLPKGYYNAIIDDITYGRSQSSNNPMVTVTSKIDSGDDKIGERSVRDFMVTTNEWGQARLKKFLRVLAPSLDLKQVKLNELGMHLTGIRYTAKLDIRPDNNKVMRNNISEYLPARNTGGDVEFKLT